MINLNVNKITIHWSQKCVYMQMPNKLQFYWKFHLYIKSTTTKNYRTNEFCCCCHFWFSLLFPSKSMKSMGISHNNHQINLFEYFGRWSKSFVISSTQRGKLLFWYCFAILNLTRWFGVRFGRLLRIQINMNQILVSNLNSKNKIYRIRKMK